MSSAPSPIPDDATLGSLTAKELTALCTAHNAPRGADKTACVAILRLVRDTASNAAAGAAAGPSPAPGAGASAAPAARAVRPHTISVRDFSALASTLAKDCGSFTLKGGDAAALEVHRLFLKLAVTLSMLPPADAALIHGAGGPAGRLVPVLGPVLSRAAATSGDSKAETVLYQLASSAPAPSLHDVRSMLLAACFDSPMAALSAYKDLLGNIQARGKEGFGDFTIRFAAAHRRAVEVLGATPALVLDLPNVGAPDLLFARLGRALSGRSTSAFRAVGDTWRDVRPAELRDAAVGLALLCGFRRAAVAGGGGGGGLAAVFSVAEPPALPLSVPTADAATSARATTAWTEFKSAVTRRVAAAASAAGREPSRARPAYHATVDDADAAGGANDDGVSELAPWGACYAAWGGRAPPPGTVCTYCGAAAGHLQASCPRRRRGDPPIPPPASHGSYAWIVERQQQAQTRDAPWSTTAEADAPATEATGSSKAAARKQSNRR